ncbi:hypothetical protein Shyhy01_66010 [Streptomyces hygroscopicus subsp. hygroscopicus]|nr:hypothetical protein Shyhy01_66010 [Streptomyces hygroscopicus subsp. hygroscopicus]
MIGVAFRYCSAPLCHAKGGLRDRGPLPKRSVCMRNQVPKVRGVTEKAVENGQTRRYEHVGPAPEKPDAVG